MIQTGDPTNTGKGGQSIWGKPFPDEIRSTLKFNARGMVAMANGGPDTNKSQFFITYAKQAHLEGKYTIFGKVIDGADTTLDTMEKIPVSEKNRPLNDIKLLNWCKPRLVVQPMDYPGRLFIYGLAMEDLQRFSSLGLDPRLKAP
ncbi:Peptidyl-prolyl cis-trans isomerase cyp10 [Tulasnella sp. 330]|nr:Peptidyl-prolyl cis-trans isomerase cyp10 [Tulasnella sp. 330]KAG8874517.1 Peptidyl-prolyl cis-trans isomerase cyp10 [Tulasnella sp. 331]KAG8879319.1 Peptidyl-prolyl cis-trans isomerase cyp10 [Tulasnella sp. 332]